MKSMRAQLRYALPQPSNPKANPRLKGSVVSRYLCGGARIIMADKGGG
eukprot:CAMPEP_0204904188 /NCGR_PEP_ID=MMETSP1397-20131031/4718_1 /ASSEMBLY_ACC=CAM_ASM_000891 /TAXON_ID=49980 /ORGANISM="Climacostomum Climacostomum virens, Strain Stock W-24" /LENGTH=47 /DNA_ID= /DNA_START= /DNA_END= /DNA_ORIENTATION=